MVPYSLTKSIEHIGAKARIQSGWKIVYIHDACNCYQDIDTADNNWETSNHNCEVKNSHIQNK